MRTHKKTNATTHQATPKTIAVLGVALAVILLGGCYWTPDSNEGDVAVSITLPGSSVGSQDVGAMQTTNGTFLYAYVLDESLMTVNPSQAALIHARIAYGDVTYAMEQALAQADYNVTNAASGFSMPVGLASNRFQQLPIAATTATGSQAFTNLPAGREFLVGVYAVHDGSEGLELSLGFGTATVQAGSTTSVNIELSDDPIPFFDYIGQSYELSSVRVFAGQDTPSGSPLYFDMALSETGTLPFISTSAAFITWYDEQLFPADVIGEQRSKSQGDRRPFRPTTSQGNDFAVVGVLPNRTWKLLVTTWPERESTPDAGDAWLSIEFSTPTTGEVELGSYEFTARFWC